MWTRDIAGLTSCTQFQEHFGALGQALGVDLGGEARHHKRRLPPIAQAHHLQQHPVIVTSVHRHSMLKLSDPQHSYQEQND